MPTYPPPTGPHRLLLRPMVGRRGVFPPNPPEAFLVAASEEDAAVVVRVEEIAGRSALAARGQLLRDQLVIRCRTNLLHVEDVHASRVRNAVELVRVGVVAVHDVRGQRHELPSRPELRDGSRHRDLARLNTALPPLPTLHHGLAVAR